MNLSVFEAARPKLTALCYRMLGEWSGAEDVVQEVWLRWDATPQSSITNPAAWLRRVATNLAIDSLRSARKKREVYVGPWLPEPLLQTEAQSEGKDAQSGMELAQECELALLWAMERLNEKERAAFILREAFDASYDDIAETLGTSVAASRQLVSRSVKKLQAAGPRFKAPAEEVADLSQRFFLAVTAEDFETALALLAPDAVSITDGGAHVRAARRPLIGPVEILQVFGALSAKAKQEVGWTTQVTMVNGKPGFLRLQAGRLDSVMTLMPDAQGRIAWIYVMRNPEKLAQVATQIT